MNLDELEAECNSFQAVREKIFIPSEEFSSEGAESKVGWDALPGYITQGRQSCWCLKCHVMTNAPWLHITQWHKNADGSLELD